MSLSSYADVFNLPAPHDEPPPEPIAPGDLVRTGPNLFPHYEVLAVSGDRAWLRNAQTGEDHLGWVERCRKVAG